jgi:hypothetical protein
MSKQQLPTTITGKEFFSRISRLGEVGFFHHYDHSIQTLEVVESLTEFVDRAIEPVRNYPERFEVIEDLDKEVISIGSVIVPISEDSVYFEHLGCFIYTTPTNTYIFTL